MNLNLISLDQFWNDSQRLNQKKSEKFLNFVVDEKNSSSYFCNFQSEKKRRGRKELKVYEFSILFLKIL